ncbi:MAG: Gram-negative bacterial TonB protein C-terminal [Pyrinomonadaceae bacterium]|nr:Gram-negative bacterial TonB protein C-terminal [Pyrinomonadaceae bacterium]
MNYLNLLRRLFPVLLSVVCLLSLSQSLRPQSRSDDRRSVSPLKILNSNRQQDGLRGPVRRLRTEVAKVAFGADGPVEGRRSLLELTAYDTSGKRVDNKTYPVVSSTLGQETHEYDDQGHLLRTTVRNERGVVLGRTEYSYEFDAAGNWVKMTSSVVVSEAGRQRLEPVEVTYRTIVYYSGGEDGAPPLAEDAWADSPDALAPAVEDSFPQSEFMAGGHEGVVAPASPPGVGLSAGGEASRKRLDVATGMEAEADKLPDVGLLNDKALSLPKPAYPINWRRAATPITVTVKVVIDETGRVIYSRAVEGPQALRRVAEDAALRAGFLPFRAGRQPFKAKGLLSYSFPFDPR